MGLITLSASFSALADVALRIKCEGAAVGAQVYINEKMVGDCPLDAFVAPGSVRLLARKTAGDYEQLFEKKLTVIEGVPQRIEITLSALQLTPEGGLKQKITEANTQLHAAEAGDVDAMKKMVVFYSTGTGVKKDAAKARLWHDKIAVAMEKQKVLDAYAENTKAMAGDINAMESMAKRCDTGTGVDKDPAQAQIWRDKIDIAKRDKSAQEKVQAKNQRINAIDYTEYTSKGVNGAGCKGNDLGEIFCIFTTGIPSSLSGMAIDLISTPMKSTQVINLKNAAMIRPSAWAKPESMMARVSAPPSAPAQPKATDVPTETAVFASTP